MKKSELQSDVSTIRAADPESVDHRAFKLMAERIALYVGDLEINEDDWSKVVRFLMHDYSFFEERRPRPDYDPHPSDFLPES